MISIIRLQWCSLLFILFPFFSLFFPFFSLFFPFSLFPFFPFFLFFPFSFFSLFPFFPFFLFFPFSFFSLFPFFPFFSLLVFSLIYNIYNISNGKVTIDVFFTFFLPRFMFKFEMGILNDLNIRNEMKDTQYLNRAMVLST